MTQEEKAKAYDEAIKRVEAVIKVAQNQKEVYGCITTIFPELKKSDMTIWENIVEAIEKDIAIGTSKVKRQALDWLEMHKPIEEPSDNDIYEELIKYFSPEMYLNGGNVSYTNVRKWLAKHKDSKL